MTTTLHDENTGSIDATSHATGFVALLDVLGFKRMEESKQIEIASILEQATDELLPRLWQLKSEQYERWLQSPIVRMFSDTIVVAFPRSPDSAVAQDLFHFVNDYLGLLFCLLMSSGFKLRGSVGYGSIIRRKYGVLGSAILEAQEEYEATSWAGIHYTVNATSVIARWHDWAMRNGVLDRRKSLGTVHNMNQTQFYVVQVPFKPEHMFPTSISAEVVRMRFTVPWPKDFRAVFELPRILMHDASTTHTRIHEVLEAECEQCSDPRVREILNNTISYADQYLLRFPELNVSFELKGPLPLMK